MHSTTKYMDGHAVQVGGVIVDSGNFDWNNGKFPMLTEPDESYHGVVYTERFGKAAYITKASTHLMRDLGAQASADECVFAQPRAWRPLRCGWSAIAPMRLRLRGILEQHEKVAWVNYPGLESSKYYALTQKYMPNGSCGVVSFGVKRRTRCGNPLYGGSQKLASIVTHVADLRTCVLHPASTTHRQLNDEQLREAGASPDLIRFSVGIENPADILADVEQALAQV